MQAFLEEVSEEELRIVRSALFPSRWTEFAQNYLLDWHIAPFAKGGAAAIPDVSGFYSFIVANTETCLPLVLFPLYAGETGDLRQRYGNYLTEKNSKRGRRHVRKFLNVFWGEVVFAYAPYDADREARRVIEKQLNNALMPPYSHKDFTAVVKAGRGAWQQ